MEEKLNGIVLSGISYGENDKILNIFTLEKGVISAKIKGVKKAGAKLKFASQPFCFAEYILRPSKAGYTVINASLTESFYSLREDIVKFYAGGVVLEFVKRFYRENIVSSETFLSVVQGLKSIAFGDNPLTALVVFLINELKRAGYALKLDGCKECGKTRAKRMFFDYLDGAFCCEECHKEGGREINPDTFLALNLAQNGQLLEKDQAVRALRLMEYYLEEKIAEKLVSLKDLLKILS